MLDWELSIYKGLLYFEEAENHSIYIDADISVVGVGFILGWEDKNFRFKIDPPGWFGFDISIDFGQIIKDIFGWEW